MRLHTSLLIGAALLVQLATGATAQNRHFDAGSLIVPADNAYQGQGIYQAYGLLYQLLKHEVTVYWVIDDDKVWHQAACDTSGDECTWDCAEEGSGVKCDYPTASPDFYVAAEVLWSDVGDAAGTTIANHGYRGGPFVIDAADREAAVAIINAWNDMDQWGDNPWADRSEFSPRATTRSFASRSQTRGPHIGQASVCA